MKRQLCVAFLLFLSAHQALGQHKKSRQDSIINSVLADNLKDQVEIGGENSSRKIHRSSTCQCGKTNPKRIIGGMEVKPARKYPWHVGLSTNPYKFYYKCGGSIINDRWILTAAHCIVEEKKCSHCLKLPLEVFYYCKNKYSASNPLKVIVGDHDQADGAYDTIAMTYNIKQYVPHPKYDCIACNDPDFALYDFALLELTTSISFDKLIRPICLPKDDSEDYVGQMGTVIGWGWTKNGVSSNSDILKEVQLIIQANNKCGRRPLLPDEKMCVLPVAGNPGKASCENDSGGSFFVFSKTTNAYVQVGVVSYVAKICDDPDYPLVYARVSKVLPWITTTTASGSRCE